MISGEKDEFQAVGHTPREKATLDGLPAEGHFLGDIFISITNLNHGDDFGSELGERKVLPAHDLIRHSNWRIACARSRALSR